MIGSEPATASPEPQDPLAGGLSFAGGAVTREDREARIRAELGGVVWSRLRRLWTIGRIRFEVRRIGSERDAQASEAFRVCVALDSAISVVDRRLLATAAREPEVQRRWAALSEQLSQAMCELAAIAEPAAASGLPHRRRLRDRARPTLRAWFLGRVQRSLPFAATWVASRWARIELALVDDGSGFEEVRRCYADLVRERPITGRPAARSKNRWRT